MLIEVQSEDRTKISWITKESLKGSYALGFIPHAAYDRYSRVRGLYTWEESGELLAFVVCRVRHLRLRIFQIWTRCDARRELFAAQMIGALLEIKKHDAVWASCWCREDLDATAFWKAVGFRAISYRRGGNQRKIDQVFFQQTLRVCSRKDLLALDPKPATTFFESRRASPMVARQVGGRAAKPNVAVKSQSLLDHTGQPLRTARPMPSL